MSKGIIILGHGSRASVGEANQVVFQVTELVKEKLGHDLVETAIMNRMSGLQSIAEAVDKLVDKGVTDIVVAPLFFANGMHIQSDIPEELTEIQEKRPGISIVMARHIGADPRIADILLDRIQEAG